MSNLLNACFVVDYINKKKHKRREIKKKNVINTPLYKNIPPTTDPKTLLLYIFVPWQSKRM